MKKIILMLLVLLCGMSLFAETDTSTFYVGDSTFMKNFGNFMPLDSYPDTHYFTKIIMSSTGGNCYEIEVTSPDSCSFTYQVYKGDVIPFNFEYFGVREVLVTAIKPNKITLQVQDLQKN